MARNKTFRQRYVIELKGISTNEFMPHFIVKTLEVTLETLQRQFKQLQLVSFTVEDGQEGGENAND